MHKIHSYEEIRAAMLDILAGRERTSYEPSQYEHARIGVAEIFVTVHTLA